MTQPTVATRLTVVERDSARHEIDILHLHEGFTKVKSDVAVLGTRLGIYAAIGAAIGGVLASAVAAAVIRFAFG
jgi:hypothetical protein